MNQSEVSLFFKRISKFLDDFGPILLNDARLEYFKLRIAKLQEKSLQDPGCLYAGLAGGSGVGKSTLVNAIARRKISHASDRRPFTDKIVAYRHIDNPRALNDLSDLFKSPDAVHDHEELKALTIFDLPDIDSHQLSNQDVVMKILPHLDAIIWVASPEKYADSSFYQLIKESSIHKDNFIFVINKMDQLIDDDSHDPLIRVREIAEDLAFRLRRHADMTDPKVFCISSMLEFKIQNGSYGEFLSHEFLRFRDCLSEKWNQKLIKKVKRTNLLNEMEDFLIDLDADIDPEKKKEALDTVKAFREIEFESIVSPKDFYHLQSRLTGRLTKIL
ncbi:MAG: GTPase, partial [Pseudomonadota bacterium]